MWFSRLKPCSYIKIIWRHFFIFLNAKVNIWINMKLEHYLADIFRIKRKNLLNKSSSVCVGNRKWHRIGLHLTTWSIQRLSFATNFSHVYSCTNNVDIFLLSLLNDLFGTISGMHIKPYDILRGHNVDLFEFHDIYTLFVN